MPPRLKFNVNNSLQNKATAKLIFAPHPDDETLACGGLINTSVARGEKSTIVFFTNGDGHSESASFLLKKSISTLNAEDFRQLGAVRKTEAECAARQLGVDKSDLVFLEYPDTRLSRLYKSERSQAMGPDASSDSVVQRLAHIIKSTNPDSIYLPAEFDAHPDHRATFWFVRDAIKQAGYSNSIFIYIVHGGDDRHWPFPRGMTPTKPIEQIQRPGNILPASAPWPPSHRIGISGSSIDAKSKALACYKSQFSNDQDREYYESFIKNEEIFWQIDPRYYPGW